MEYERELISLPKLRLNKENDRHGSLASEHDSIVWLLTHYRDHIVNLAKDIAEHGLSPIESVMVLPAGDEAPGDYVVWEGNRRVCALKLLDDPNRCHDQKLHRRFQDIKGKAKVAIPQEVECVIAPSVEEAERLIELRHQGPQDGVGTVPWDARQKELHQQRLGKRGRYAFSHQVLDAITNKLDNSLRERVQAKGFPISTLDRILHNGYAREFLGLSTEGGAPQRVLEEKETFKGLTNILTDLAEGMQVSKVYTSDQIRDYLGSFDKKATPDQKKTLSNPAPLSAPGGKGAVPATAPIRSRPLAHERKKLIPSGVSYSIEDKRVNTIYHELRKLDDHTYRNAAAVLFRVFLELSVELYLDKHGIPFGPRDNLSVKAGKAAADMKKQGWLDRRASKGIDSAVASGHGPHTVDTFHAYVHNRRFQPVPSDLNTAFDNLQPFFDTLFGHLK